LRLEPEYVREPFYDDIPFGPDACADHSRAEEMNCNETPLP
jgi:hypothetical protein